MDQGKVENINQQLENHAKDIQEKMGGVEKAAVLTAVIPADPHNKSAEVS
jgi:hypothetical protein